MLLLFRMEISLGRFRILRLLVGYNSCVPFPSLTVPTEPNRTCASNRATTVCCSYCAGSAATTAAAGDWKAAGADAEAVRLEDGIEVEDEDENGALEGVDHRGDEAAAAVSAEGCGEEADGADEMCRARCEGACVCIELSARMLPLLADRAMASRSLPCSVSPK